MTRRNPTAILLAISAGLLLTLAPLPAFAAGPYKVIDWFNATNGEGPESSLVFDGSGNLYGTTREGGKFESGTVFELTPNGNGGWTSQVLYNFCSRTDCVDGRSPIGGLIFDSSGNLYGALSAGAAGGGAIFELSPEPGGKWTQQVIYAFCGSGNSCAGGSYPSGALVFDTSGNLYGSTWAGGTNGYFGGVVFQLTPGANGAWTQNVLYSFCSLSECADGESPVGSMAFDASGNLYGATQYGGVGHNKNCGGYCGAIFELTPGPNGVWTEQVIHSFDYSGGALPTVGLIFDPQGNLYGATTVGGKARNGLVFKLAPGTNGSWTETVLHAFQTPGLSPYSALTFNPAGNLCGAASGGGEYGKGIVFKLSPTPSGPWTQTILHSFDPQSGDVPQAGVISDSQGNLYGTASLGGQSGNGAVFELTP
jgi:uncharacterized repeat protein (TIGR03803 family)